MKLWIKRTGALSLSFGMMIPVLAACTSPNTTDNTERTLRIATTMGYSQNDEYFRQRFTELYEFANPNVKFEVISMNDDRYMYGGRPDPNEKPEDPLKKLKESMQSDNPPDIVMVGYEQLPELISENMLTQLDPLITKDKFDISDIVPAVIEGIKKVGEGKIYALAPTFNSSAIIYNKRLFDEAGVPYPTDKMTWEQTFDLARRLSRGEGENRKYGFSFSTYNMGGDLSYPTQIYTAPLQLRMFDDKGEKMTVDSDQWENAWKTMLQLQTEKLIPGPIDMSKMSGMGPDQGYNPFQHDDFMSGRVAMSIINYGELDRVINAMKNAEHIQGFTPFEWDVVTLPVHQEAPDMGGFIGLDGIMSINAKAQNAEEAWKYIKFLNGEDWARLKAGSSHNIVSRQKYIKKKDGAEYNQQAFTLLMPVPYQDGRIYLQNPRLYDVQGIGYQKLQQVAEGKLEVREALRQWQAEGDAMIQQSKENPNGQPGMPVPTPRG